MSAVSKIVSQPRSASPVPVSTEQGILRDQAAHRTLWLQVAIGYVLLMASLWTPPGPLAILWIILTVTVILGLAFKGRYTTREMGLTWPTLRVTLWIVGIGLALTAAIPAFAALTHTNEGPTHVLPLRTAWRYVLWALEQEFILQSFFYLRMETLLGGRKAVFITALLFSSVHIPSPILTLATLIGGVFFCEMFRRFRNILQLGLVHAAMGLTVAASFSDSLLHNMRVGIGYLHFP
jgi:membrane protease YdiL (CAAX protease family)